MQWEFKNCNHKAYERKRYLDILTCFFLGESSQIMHFGKNQGRYKSETAVGKDQFCLEIQLDFDNLLGALDSSISTSSNCLRFWNTLEL